MEVLWVNVEALGPNRPITFNLCLLELKVGSVTSVKYFSRPNHKVLQKKTEFCFMFISIFRAQAKLFHLSLRLHSDSAELPQRGLGCNWSFLRIYQFGLAEGIWAEVIQYVALRVCGGLGGDCA